MCRRVLLPHDNLAEHEAALPVAVEFARLCGAGLHLVRVVPTRRTLKGHQSAAGGLLPGAAQTMLEIERQEAGHDMEGHRQQLRRSGLDVTTEVLRGDPVGAIATACATVDADLIVLATHGTAGTRAFWAGSVTAGVCARCAVNVLLVPVA